MNGMHPLHATLRTPTRLRLRYLPGFALADCHEVYGDDLERAVAWKGNPDLGALAGKPVRLRFELRDADLYSYRFQ